MTDALGHLVGIAIPAGWARDLKELPQILEWRIFGALLADRAFDTDWLVYESGGANRPRSNRKVVR